MPRGRGALTDKEERILVQAQLMGLSTQSMVKIGNRLKALEQEREEIANINEMCQGFDWDEPKNNDKLIVRYDGYVIEATRTNKGDSRWNFFSWKYNIKITKPGTRYKPRSLRNQELNCNYDWKKRLMPGKSKELYSLIRLVKFHRLYEGNDGN